MAAVHRPPKQSTHLQPRLFISTDRVVLGGCNRKHMAFSTKGRLGLLLVLRPWLRSQLLLPTRCKSVEEERVLALLPEE